MPEQNGLQQALTTVLNTQAAMQGTTALLQQAMIEFTQRFARMESELIAIHSEQAAIRTMLVRHEEILRDLPEAVQRRAGFQGQP